MQFNLRNGWKLCAHAQQDVDRQLIKTFIWELLRSQLGPIQLQRFELVSLGAGESADGFGIFRRHGVNLGKHVG